MIGFYKIKCIGQLQIIDNLYWDEFFMLPISINQQITRILGNRSTYNYDNHIQLMIKILNKEFYRDWI